MIPNLLLFCLLDSWQSDLLCIFNYCVICMVDTVRCWWFRVDCLSAAGPLDISMGFVFLKRQKQMRSVGEDYHTEFKFNSQGPSLYMPDNLHKSVGSPRFPSRQWRPVAGPCVTFITIVAEKSCLVAVKVQAVRVERIGGDPEILLLFLSWCPYRWKSDMQYPCSQYKYSSACRHLFMLPVLVLRVLFTVNLQWK